MSPVTCCYFMFWNIWNLSLWNEAGKKWWSSYYYSKYRAFILGKSEQQFKIQSCFGILDAVNLKGQRYDDVLSQALKCICETFGNICCFYSMK